MRNLLQLILEDGHLPTKRSDPPPPPPTKKRRTRIRKKEGMSVMCVQVKWYQKLPVDQKSGFLMQCLQAFPAPHCPTFPQDSVNYILDRVGVRWRPMPRNGTYFLWNFKMFKVSIP